MEYSCAFIFAAENHVKSARKSGNGFERGIHVGGFGVVEKLHAADFRDEFKTVLDARKAANASGDRRTLKRP